MIEWIVTHMGNNKYKVEFGPITFYAYIDIVDGKKIIKKPRNVYVDRPEWHTLAALIFREHNRLAAEK